MMSIYRYSLLAASLVSLIGCNQASVTSSHADSAKAKQERPIQVIQLESASQQSSKTFTGKLQSVETAGVAFRVPGTIQELFVKTGDRVQKGQPIAQLDPHDYQVALEELQARALEAKSAHKLAKAELARVKQAIADDAIANVNLDRAISGYERSEAAVKVVEQNIRRAKDSVRYTRLLAPFDGVIASSNFDQYEQVLPGVAVFTIHKPEQLEVTIDVPENLIHQFEAEQQATISWYHAKKSITGHATEISTLPHPIKQTYSVTYRLDDLTNTDTRNLLPGKAVTLTTELGESSNNFCLPYSSIVNQSGNEQVFVIKGSQAESVPINITSVRESSACVDSTLNDGDYVVVSGAQYIKEGQHFSSIQVKEL
ncbi:efflux RND transporter periplasmic adaptor subunit [Vibrio sp. Isolate22]|uniref:efflux RND transporter periplasmic adaptor subunit n=1 Tax=Vibrio sp. Isolate22 TaxID=2908532 RepID=UPI001EFEC08A|nr:efflux RND transporter periplasmic adaptor subunit [Vibrio sp. Isolate22]MCG9692670.1 efflux RND transporter periplasmic adaptor subunit [Vibrio sp. Isolate22]